MEMSPRPSVVDEAEFEESDIVDVRARSFPASSDFFDQAYESQFGGDEDEWEDDDGDDDGDDDDDLYDDHLGAEPECRHQ